MKGTLRKTELGWQVEYQVINSFRFLPLNPYDVNQIEEDSKRFDNIEARIAAYPDVEFRIEEFWETGMEEVIKVATLVPDYPELEGTNNLCNDIIKKRTGKMTEEEWQAAERAQTISDEEIERLLKERWGLNEEFIAACKWYREQYKKK